jgi:hypothetical protein
MGVISAVQSLIQAFSTAGRDAVVSFMDAEGGADNIHKALDAGGAAGEQFWKSMADVGQGNAQQAAATIEKVRNYLAGIGDTNAIQSMFADINAGGDAATQATTDLDNAVKTLGDNASKTNGLWSQSLQSIIKQSQDLGLNLASVSSLLAQNNKNLETGLEGALTPGANAINAASADQKIINDPGQSADAVAKAMADLATQQQIINATVVSTQKQASAAASAIVGEVDAAMKSGTDFVTAVKNAQPSIQALQTQLQKAGLQGGDAFNFLNNEVKLATGAITGPALQSVEGYTQAMVALANSGGLTQDTFAGLEDQIGSTYDALIAQGADGKAAVAAMQPDLQAAWEAEQQFGYVADDATQKLIDQAEQSGIVGEKQKSSTQQMIDALNNMGNVLTAIATKMGAIGTAAQNAAQVAQGAFNAITAPDFSKTIGGSSSTSGPNSVDTGSGSQPPALASGAFVRSPMLAIVGDSPGGEYVIPAGKMGRDYTSLTSSGGSVSARGDTYIDLRGALFPDRQSMQDLATILSPHITPLVVDDVTYNRGAAKTNLQAGLK